MKKLIQIASDLHIEFAKDGGASIVTPLVEGSKLSQVKTILLAGDIAASANFDTLKDIFQRFCDEYSHVIFVPGNHEYYGNSVWRTEEHLLRLQSQLLNFHLLN